MAAHGSLQTLQHNLPDRVREHFSRRGREAKAIRGGRRLTSDLAQDAGLARYGRPDKAAWRAEAQGHGWSPEVVPPNPMVARAKEIWRAMERVPHEGLAESLQRQREIHALTTSAPGSDLDSTHESLGR